MLSNFSFKKTPFKDLLVLNQFNFNDNRGSFIKLYSENFFKKKKFQIRQVNYSLNKTKGTIRGMHYQVGGFAEEKIVTCIKGKIFDVVIDLRKNSKTYLKWYKIILNSKYKRSLFVPKGFAHGFQTLDDNTEIIYLHSKNHSKKHERTINSIDPKISIKWPIKKKIFSYKDRRQHFINNNFRGISV